MEKVGEGGGRSSDDSREGELIEGESTGECSMRPRKER